MVPEDILSNGCEDKGEKMTEFTVEPKCNLCNDIGYVVQVVNATFDHGNIATKKCPNGCPAQMTMSESKGKEVA